MKGRKPLPTVIKKLRGESRPSRINDQEAQPGPLTASPPAHLGREAKKHWCEAHELLTRTGVLSEMDSDALVLYSVVMARWNKATKHLEKNGLTVLAQSGFEMQSPYLSIANKCFDQLLKLQIEMGMTPSARSRVNATPPPAPNPFQGLEPEQELRAREQMRKEGKLDDWEDFERTGELNTLISEQKREQANVQNNSN